MCVCVCAYSIQQMQPAHLTSTASKPARRGTSRHYEACTRPRLGSTTQWHRSKIGRMDGRAIPLLDRKVVCFLFFWEWLQWSPRPQLLDVVLCSVAQCSFGCSCSGSYSLVVVVAVVAVVVVVVIVVVVVLPILYPWYRNNIQRSPLVLPLPRKSLCSTTPEKEIARVKIASGLTVPKERGRAKSLSKEFPERSEKLEALPPRQMVIQSLLIFH